MKTARQTIPQRKELLSLLLALGLVLLVAIFTYRAWSAYGRRGQELEITQQIISVTNELLSSLKDAETGQRGFLLTGDDRYLEPYRRASIEIPAALSALKGVTAQERPDQALRADRLGQPIKNKLDELRQTIELRRSSGFSAALAMVLTDRGKAEMDQIRSICAEIQAAANQRLARFSEETRASSYQLGLVSTLGSSTLFLLLLFSTITIQRATARRQHLIERLQESGERLTEARDWLHTTIASIGDAVIATDFLGRIAFLNAVAQSLTGWTQEDAAGKQLEEIFVIRNEKTGAVAENPVSKALREGRTVGLANHTVLLAKDGRHTPIEDSAAPIKDEHNRVLGVVLVFRDVTERRKSDAALARSEERLKLALAAGEIGVWDWDIIPNHIEWSDRVYDILVVERGSFGGRFEDLATLIHPEDRRRIGQAIQTALRGDTPYDVEFRVVHPNGAVVWVSTNGAVFRDDDGQPTRMLGGITDVTARKQAEDQMRQQWRTFDAALSNTPDFVYIFDPAGRFTYVNRALLALWQRPLEEAVGKNFFDLGYPPELAARLQRQIQQVIDTQEPLRDVTAFTGPTGETRQYEYIFVPIVTPGGVQSVAGATRDITERSRAEEALRISEERLTLALEAGGGVGTWDWEIPGDRVYCNPQFAILFSIDPERAAGGVPISEFLAQTHPDDRGRVADSMELARTSGGEFAMEYRVIQTDASVRWIYARGRCHLDEAGKPTRFPGVVIDITERKRAGEALRESDDRLRAIYDGTYEYIGLLSPDGTLLEANRASLTFADNTREEVVGRPFWDIPWFTGTPGAPEAVREGIARAARGEFVRFEATVRRPSGESPTFDISFHPIRNELGEVVLIVPEGRDITELKRAEEDLRRSNEQLKRANRELEEFAYVASHDLQEPLRMVNIYTQLILREIGGAKNLEGYGGFVQQGVARMEALIHDLLAFSRTVHAERVQLGVGDLSASLNEALFFLKDRIAECGAVITADALPAVRGDTSQMAHVFQNLLSNALKYCNRGVPPLIHISAEQKGKTWTVSVRDNGIGFEPEYAERIFGLFKRLHNEEYPGTGLGLAICKRIVERYGGRIWAEGSPGAGATFHFSLLPADEQ
jgi:PAS domain S-box-containing protein